MKFLLPNYSCLQNPWLGCYRPQIPVLSVLCPQLNLMNPPEKKFLGTPLKGTCPLRAQQSHSSPSLIPAMTLINPVHISTSYFLQNRLNIIPTPTPRLHLFRLPRISHWPLCVPCLDHFIMYDMITLITFREWVWNLVADIEGGKEAEGVWEYCVEENMWT